MEKGQPYVSGDWMVKPGNEEAFIAQWTEFTGWSKENSPVADGFFLLRDAADSRHFVSYGIWPDIESRDEWRNSETFAELLGKTRALCEDFRPTEFTLAAFSV